MKSTMSEEKVGSPLDSSTIFVTESNVRKISTRKYVVVVAGILLSCALILATVLIGMHIFTAAQKDIVKLTLEQKDNFKGELISDMEGNRVQYHIYARNFEAWAEDAFHQGIRVMKLKSSSSDVVCCVMPLNGSALADERHMNRLSKMKKLIIPSNYSHSAYDFYEFAENPISDLSFLSKSVREMCDKISTYWIYPRCHASENGKDLNELQRQKRGWGKFVIKIILKEVVSTIGDAVSYAIEGVVSCALKNGKCDS